MIQQHARKPELPACIELMDALVDHTWKAPRLKGLEAETQRVVSNVVLYHLFAAATNARAAPQVRAIAHRTLRGLEQGLLPHRLPAPPNRRTALSRAG
jgi:hypothetical protein